MSGIASGPPVLNTETYFIHSTFSKCEKISLTARIQFFSGNITHRMADAQFIMLPTATSVASMTREEVNRVRSSEMLEDHLKKKLGREYSTYLDLPNPESTRGEESSSDPESDGSPPAKAQERTKQVKELGARNPESLRPQPNSSMRRLNPFTHAQLRELEKYVARYPPNNNRSGRPAWSWWSKLCEDCEWARTHSTRSWAAWAGRSWEKWCKVTKTRRKLLQTRSTPAKSSVSKHSAKASSRPKRVFKETAARRKVLETRSIPAKSSISPHSTKASSARPKRVETVMLTSSDDEGDDQSSQATSETNRVEDTRNNPEASASTPSSKVPQQANQPVAVATRPLSRPSPPLPTNHSRSHLGFACWRRRPRVLVADSDPSQTTATTQTTNLGPTQFTQPTSIPVILADQKAHISIQASPNVSQQPQIQSQRSSQAASANRSRSSGQNPWIAPDGADSDSDYSATHHSFDDSDDDGWSENSSDNGTEDEDPESLLPADTLVSSGSPVTAGKRHSSPLSSDGDGTGLRELIDKRLPDYFDRAILEYGETQTQYQIQSTQQSQSQTSVTLSSQQQQMRRQIVNSVLSLVSHWMQIPLPKVRNVWKSLPKEKRTFDELQKKCLQCDLSASRREYDATGLFTQQRPRSRVRKWDEGNGPIRKRRKLTTFPPLRRGGSSNTEADFDGTEESEIYFGAQDPDAPAGCSDGEDEEDDGADKEPPPILFRQTRLVPGSAKSLHPYPTRPDKEWAKRICRVLAATYGWRRASKVYEIWEEVGGDAKRVERSLKDKSSGVQKVLLDLGLGDIPRPWA